MEKCVMHNKSFLISYSDNLVKYKFLNILYKLRFSMYNSYLNKLISKGEIEVNFICMNSIKFLFISKNF